MQQESIEIQEKLIRKTDLYVMHKVKQQQKNTFGKIFFDKVLNEHEITEAIYYNSEVLEDNFDQFRFKEYMLPIKSYPHQSGIIFVTPTYDYRLDQYVDKKGPLDQEQVMKIGQQILKAIYGLVVEGYFHRSIRAEHFVFSNGRWKLQSLVLDEKPSQKGIKSQYFWSNQHQPPQIYEQESITEEQLDQKAVWDLGALIIHLILGHHKLKNRDVLNMFKDQPFSFQRIKANVGNRVSKQMKQILGQMCHYKKQQRMTLKNLLKNGFFSEKIKEDFEQTNPEIVSNIIVPNSSSASKVRMSGIKKANAQSAEAYMKSSKQKQNSLMSSSQKTIPSRVQFIGILQQIHEDADNQIGSSVIMNKNKINSGIKQTNFEMINSKASAEMKKVLNQFKNYIDKGEILTISEEKLKKALTLKNDQKQAEILLVLTQYSLYFVKAMDLCLLAKTMNNNSEFFFFKTDSPQWDSFHGSEEYYSLRKLVNYRKNEAICKLFQIKTLILNQQDLYLKKFSKQVDKFVKNCSEKQANFNSIKYPYRQIIKKSYDLVSEHYKENKDHEWATIGMYLTFCLTIDKLYQKQHFKDNFKHYFKWKGQQSQFVPLDDFQKYMQTAENEILLNNSIYIIKKYFQL